MTVDIQRTGPIFIVGSPRSGTTLLRAMLNRHPRIQICDETYFFYYIAGRRRTFGNPETHAARRTLVDRYMSTYRVRRLGLDAAVLRDKLMREGTSYPALFSSLMRCYAEQTGKPRFGEKTPEHALVARTLCEWYPDCALIHLVRDPRDVVSSLLTMPWASQSVIANARLWWRCNRAVADCSGRANYLLVKYEQLVEQAQDVLATVCKFIGEEPSSRMIESSDEAVSDRPWFVRAQQPLTKNRIGTWTSQLSPRQVALVEWVAAPQMRNYGYALLGKDLSASDFVRGWLEEMGDFVMQRYRKLPRLWYRWLRPASLAAEEKWNDRCRRVS